jgi:hypothetical protein
MTIIAELPLDLVGHDGTVAARLFAPEQRIEGPGWTCRFEIGEPISYGLDIAGESSLQAVALALKGLAACLYGSEEYRTGKLGVYGEFGGFLGIPAPKIFLDEAPYPF